jgi:hypothetical protein
MAPKCEIPNNVVLAAGVKSLITQVVRVAHARGCTVTPDAPAAVVKTLA